MLHTPKAKPASTFFIVQSLSSPLPYQIQAAMAFPATVASGHSPPHAHPSGSPPHHSARTAHSPFHSPVAPSGKRASPSGTRRSSPLGTPVRSPPWWHSPAPARSAGFSHPRQIHPAPRAHRCHSVSHTGRLFFCPNANASLVVLSSFLGRMRKIDVVLHYVQPQRHKHRGNLDPVAANRKRHRLLHTLRGRKDRLRKRHRPRQPVLAHARLVHHLNRKQPLVARIALHKPNHKLPRRFPTGLVAPSSPLCSAIEYPKPFAGPSTPCSPP